MHKMSAMCCMWKVDVLLKLCYWIMEVFGRMMIFDWNAKLFPSSELKLSHQSENLLKISDLHIIITKLDIVIHQFRLGQMNWSRFGHIVWPNSHKEVES